MSITLQGYVPVNSLEIPQELLLTRNQKILIHAMTTLGVLAGFHMVSKNPSPLIKKYYMAFGGGTIGYLFTGILCSRWNQRKVSSQELDRFQLTRNKDILIDGLVVLGALAGYIISNSSQISKNSDFSSNMLKRLFCVCAGASVGFLTGGVVVIHGWDKCKSLISTFNNSNQS